MDRQKLIVLLGAFGVVLVIALAIVGIFFNPNAPDSSKNPATPGGEEVVDPISGETIYKHSNLTQSGQESQTPSRPVMLGFGKLTDYGMSYDQTQRIATALTNFSTKQTPTITTLSLYKDSYRQQVATDAGAAHITFMIRANEKTDYYVDVAYGEAENVTTTIYDADKKTVLFTQ